jgi:hypothetical protein
MVTFCVYSEGWHTYPVLCQVECSRQLGNIDTAEIVRTMKLVFEDGDLMLCEWDAWVASQFTFLGAILEFFRSCKTKVVPEL